MLCKVLEMITWTWLLDVMLLGGVTLKSALTSRKRELWQVTSRARPAYTLLYLNLWTHLRPSPQVVCS
jgi:hypothetical protein